MENLSWLVLPTPARVEEATEAISYGVKLIYGCSGVGVIGARKGHCFMSGVVAGFGY